MTSNSNTFRISNEQLLLINILNTMYNDNLRQINNITDSLNNLYNTNNQIRNLLIQLLSTNQNPSREHGNRRNHYVNRRNGENNSYSDRNRIFFNNRPYIIDSVTEYTIPRQFLVNNTNPNPNPNSNLDILTQMFQNFMQPVEIYPTQSQIEAATRNVRYCDISRPINTQCPISMEDFDDNNMVTVIRHCGHIFNTEHLMNWFRTNCRCPVCRYDIRDFSSNASNQFFNNPSSRDTNQTNQTNEIRNNTPTNTTTNNTSNRDSSFDNRNSLRDQWNGINTDENINVDLSNNNINLLNDQYRNNLGNGYFDNFAAELLRDISGNFVGDMNTNDGNITALYLMNLLTRNRNYR
jgi:hypothetical protein